jgi:hypothetical protein
LSISADLRLKITTQYWTDSVSTPVRVSTALAIPTRRAGTRSAHGSIADAELPTAKPARK